MPRRLSARLTVGVALTLTAIVAPARPASADLAPSWVDVDDTVLVLIAQRWVSNHFVITQPTPTSYRIVDFRDGAPLTTLDPACLADGFGTMVCTAPDVLWIRVVMWEGDDTLLNYTTRRAHVDGGPGNDSIHLGGKDGLVGRALGGPGNDYISSGPGDDIIEGGEGIDIAGFSGSEPVNASLVTGRATRTSDTDELFGVESLAGGAGGDFLTGDAGPNRLRGGGGDDVLTGGVGDDLIEGDSGNDILSGDDGDDLMRAHDGDDFLSGGPGLDIAEADAGTDSCTPVTETRYSCERIVLGPPL